MKVKRLALEYRNRFHEYQDFNGMDIHTYALVALAPKCFFAKTQRCRWYWECLYANLLFLIQSDIYIKSKKKVKNILYVQFNKLI